MDTSKFFKWMALGATAGLGAWQLRRRGRRMDFAHKVVVITGGSRGLGLVMARELARQGAYLALLARNGEELARAQQELEDIGPGSVMIGECDVGNREQVREVLGDVLDCFGRIDVLINNAGVIQVGPFQHMSLGDFEEAMNAHFWGPLYTMLEVIPHMAGRGGGRIVNISSVGGRIAVPHMAPYSASKFALVGLSDALRSELRPLGIAVTTVCPGLMRTGSHVNALFKGKHGAEFAWFSVSNSLAAARAQRAAHRIIEACRYGRAHLDIGVSTRLAAVSQALTPGLVGELLAAVNRLLPKKEERFGDETWLGAECRPSWIPALFTYRADRAVEQNNEHPGL